MKREFLGWDRPLLHLTADYLIEKHTTVAGRLDLKSVTLVLPSSRAWNRLEEILAERAATMTDPAWYPPEFLPLDKLPEKFYKSKKPIAGKMTQCFAWLEAIDILHKEKPEVLRALLPHIPENIPENFESRLAIGNMLVNLHDELAAEDVDFEQVAQACAELNVTSEVPRWEALVALRKIYSSEKTKTPGTLDRRELVDKQLVRQHAIHHQTKEEEEQIRQRLKKEGGCFYLVGIVAMSKLQREILNKYNEFITSLVFAPNNDANKKQFDDFGCLQVNDWFEAPVEIDDSKIDIVWQPKQQVEAVMKKIDSLEGKFASSQIVIGVPDKEVIPFIQQRLTQRDIPSHRTEGKTICQTRPFRLLEVLLKCLKTKRFRDYAEWLRHPDVENFLIDNLKGNETLKGTFEYFNLITQIDKYYNTFYPVEIEETWKSYVNRENEKYSKSFPELQASWDILKELVGDSLAGKHEPKPLANSLTIIEKILKKIYASSATKESHQAKNQILEVSQSMRESVSTAEQFNIPEALRLLLMEVESSKILTDKEPDAIALLRWSELPMDDSPIVLVTSMNDGLIPSSLSSDRFLPDKLRTKLGLPDSRCRVACDAYRLMVLMKTRESVGDFQFIAGRRSLAGDALHPSRFFFASSDKRKMAERIGLVFAHEQPDVVEETDEFEKDLELIPKKHQFTIPELVPPSQWISKSPPKEGEKVVTPDNNITSISITELKEYLKCPYRYFLKKRMHLKSIDDLAEEMQHFDFGNFVHEIVQSFGQSEVKDSTSSQEIEQFFSERIKKYAKERFGESPRAAIAIQIKRATSRLKAFAEKQAERREAGWKIVEVEYSPTTPIQYAGVEIHGKIDRIDQNEETGEFTVLDYKTGEKEKPEATHYDKKNNKWIDLQLPLYEFILREAGYVKPDTKIQLGYVAIPGTLKDTGVNLASWSREEVEDAINRAKAIIEAIKKDETWHHAHHNITSPPPKYSEDVDYICQSFTPKRTW